MRIAPLILASHLHFPFSVSGFTQNTREAQMTCYQASSSSSSSCFCAFSLTALSVYSYPVFFSFFFSLTLHLPPRPHPSIFSYLPLTHKTPQPPTTMTLLRPYPHLKDPAANLATPSNDLITSSPSLFLPSSPPPNGHPFHRQSQPPLQIKRSAN